MGPEFQSPSVETTVIGSLRDLGGFEVRRVLPSAKRRMVGPFIFLDQMGPLLMPGGKGLDVRPHPHIGLETVTYLFEGSILHRDSLGSVQMITPGAINWMTAGHGIVHSERSSDLKRAEDERLHGLQMWVALPKDKEKIDPAFVHYPSDDFPTLTDQGVSTRVLAGEAFGVTSPVQTQSDLVYADMVLEAGGRLKIDTPYEERAVYLIEGRLRIDGISYDPAQLLVFKPGAEIIIEAIDPARLVLVGGENLGHRHVWWNFVASDKDQIEDAKADWKAGRFPQVPGETEWIPLPE